MRYHAFIIRVMRLARLLHFCSLSTIWLRNIEKALDIVRCNKDEDICNEKKCAISMQLRFLTMNTLTRVTFKFK